ncbi:MAG: NAD(P)/FAD-dependent oxidoreductase [Thermoplasmata archaeon]
MEKANIVIIGAGIVGMAIAASISENNESVFILEKNRIMGLETSSHNSGVVHSGIHYPNHTLKAKLSIKGNSMIYEISKKFNLPFKRLGKITVANTEAEIEELNELMRYGVENEIEGIRFLNRNEIKEMEPNVEAELALYTPTTGIVEPTELMNYFYSKSMNNGAYLALNTKVNGLRKKNDGYEISCIDNDRRFSIEAKTVINSAGLYSDKIAEMLGMNIDELKYRQEYYKGDYYRISGNPPVRMLVYPVPNGPGLGIHLTPDISGSVRAGPNAYKVSEIDYKVETKEEDFRDSIRSYLPSIDRFKLNEDSSGIRPRLKFSKSNFRDFIIRHEEDRGMFGLINLIGIESPGLTAAPAIGEYVSEIYENEIKR